MATKKSATAETTSEAAVETTSEAVATAETTSEETTVTTGKKVKVRLPRLEGQNASQEEFFSLNFKNYIIKRGEDVEIPEELAEVIRNGEKAKDAAFTYAEEHKLREA